MRCWIILLCAFLPACERYRYQIDLTPRGTEMERALVVESVQTAMSGGPVGIAPEEAKRLADLYNTEHKDLKKLAFTARFQKAMPQDVGGAGSHAAFVTTLGTFHLYSERFRGIDDLVAQWERQEAAIDLLADLAIAWAEDNLRNEQGLDALTAFMTGPMRRDLKNAALHLQRSGALAEPQLGSEELNSKEVRRRLVEVAGVLGQYLMERGYIDTHDLPVIYRSAMDDVTDVPDPAMRLAQRQILKRMGRSEQEPPPAIAALDTREAWHRSVSTLVESQAAARLLSKWNDKRTPRIETASGKDLAGYVLGDAIGASILPDIDRVTLRLRAPEDPFATNGHWDQAAGVVTWMRSIEVKPEEAAGLPMVAFALWCQPDEAEQTRRFGGVRLRGEKLASYCLLRAALSKQEADQWEALLASLNGNGWEQKVRAFRFREDQQTVPAIAKSLTASQE